MGSIHNENYAIRIPLQMVQITGQDGSATPVSFEWTDEDGGVMHINIDKVISCQRAAELKSGVTGDRYECLIDGRLEYLYFSIVAPRKWFRLKPVTEAEYKAYYRRPGEPVTDRTLRYAKQLKVAEPPEGYIDDIFL